MRKPSIFSKDYEKQMKARRRKIIAIILIVALALLLIFTKILASELSFNNLKVKLQTWIDTDKESQTLIEEDTSSEEDLSREEGEKREKEVPEETLLTKDIKISEQDTLKIGYEKLNNKEVFTEVIENKSNLYTTFNENKDLVLIIDKNQNMKIININNQEKTITKEVYTSPKGESFSKDTILDYYKEYLWNSEARFISKDKVAYISNMPYFGYNLNKYIWIYDIIEDEHKLLLSSLSKEIKFNELKDKGLEISLDEKIKYINESGEIVN